MRRLLAQQGIATIDADSIGHDVLGPGGPGFDEVAARWPEVVDEGRIDRRRLGTIVFADPAELEVLESITHPHIFGAIKAQVEQMGFRVVVEAPLPGQRLGGGWRQMVVDSRDEVRIARAVDRGIDESAVRERMAAQPSRAEWLSSAELVVPNHGTVEDLERTVRAVVAVL